VCCTIVDLDAQSVHGSSSMALASLSLDTGARVRVCVSRTACISIKWYRLQVYPGDSDLLFDRLREAQSQSTICVLGPSTFHHHNDHIQDTWTEHYVAQRQKHIEELQRSHSVYCTTVRDSLTEDEPVPSSVVDQVRSIAKLEVEIRRAQNKLSTEIGPPVTYVGCVKNQWKAFTTRQWVLYAQT
jgi:hypothetical protein